MSGTGVGEETVGWRDPGPPSRWLRSLLAAFVVVALASAAVLGRFTLQTRGTAPGDPDDLAGTQTAAQVLWGVQAAVMLVVLVLVVTWTRRLAANHVALSRPGTRFGTPGWAVGAWLVWFVLPYLVVRELWKGADPGVPEGSPSWRGVPTSPLVPVWFATFVVGVLATNLTNDALSAAGRADPDRLAALAAWRVGATVLLVASALVLRSLAGRLTDRQVAAVRSV